MQKNYFRAHGTTLRGLMAVDRIDPQEFLAYVHAVDLSSCLADPRLAAALTALAGRKLVHTNGSVRHAMSLLDHLGIAASFAGVIDIAAAGYEPKPALAGYEELLRRDGVRAATALMVEDMAKNLAPAAALGMTTAWVRGTLDWAAAGAEGDYIHHVVEDLGGFLTAASAMQIGSGRNDAVADTIRRKLTERLAPIRLDIVDESHRHAGHAGARPEGETHFQVTIVSAAFAGQTGWRASASSTRRWPRNSRPASTPSP